MDHEGRKRLTCCMYHWPGAQDNVESDYAYIYEETMKFKRTVDSPRRELDASHYHRKEKMDFVVPVNRILKVNKNEL